MTLKDKRHFRRYSKTADFLLKSDRDSHMCKLVDYSLGGAGAVVRDNSSLRKGQLVRVSIRKPFLDFNGEIAWTNSTPEGLYVGIRNTGQLKGIIEDFRLADTLIGIQRTLSTGVLRFESGDISKNVYVRNGDMIFASSNQKGDRLGDLLLREEIITQDQYSRSVEEMKKTGQKQGAILVRLGYLRPDELVAAVRHYVEEIIKSLFLLEKGRFFFDESPLPSEEVITLKLSAANLIYSGVKKAVHSGHFETELPSPDCRPCFASDPLDLFQDIKLDTMGKRTVSLIDGRTSIKDIISVTGFDGPEITKTLYALMSVRMIEIAEDCKASDGIPGEVFGETFAKKPAPEMAAELRGEIEQMHGKYESLGYYAILGLRSDASHYEIKSAYYKSAKTFHPDMHFNCADESIKSKLSDIFSYIHRAYSTLSDPKKRREYDSLLAASQAGPIAAKDRAKARFEKGKRHFKREDYRNAELLFGQTIYFDDTVAEYHYYHGLALLRQHRQRHAAKSMEAALRLDPYNTTYLAEFGFVLLALGFPKRAKGLFERVLRKSPDHARSLEGLAKISDKVTDVR